jgi:CubicO group peptidase (beta-lactamase class C family)
MVRSGLIAGVILAAVATSTRAADPFGPTAIDALVRAALKEWDVPGVAVVIVSPDRVLYLRGHGLSELGRHDPVTPDTLFPLASCSKAFTSALLAMLADEGKAAWDDPVRRHLPDFHLSDPLADAGVTLRDLLCHRTGVASHDYLWYRSPLKPEELIHRAGRLPLERPFRTAFQYQSVLYAAAAFAAGRAGGDSWEHLIERRLFEPLGMARARCTTPPDGERATPHRVNRRGELVPIPWYVQAEPNPAGSIHATARDLAGWLQFQLGEGAYQGRLLATAASLRETHVPQIPMRMEGPAAAANPETVQLSYGLGWVVQDYRGRSMVSHGGAIDGFRAHVTLLPRDGFAFAVLCNRHNTRMTLALNNALTDQLLGLAKHDWNGFFRELARGDEERARQQAAARAAGRRPDEPPSRPLDEYAGEYEHPAYGRATMVVEGGKLVWSWSSFREGLGHYRGDTFEVTDERLNDPLITFRVDKEGVRGLEFQNVEFKRTK